MVVINSPKDYVMGILMGYPKSTARKRLLFMLRAFLDGSGPGHANGIYVMAGYVAFCSTWADIAGQWDTSLNLKPAIPKFRMASARDPKWRGKHGITEFQMESRIHKLSILVTPPRTLFSVVCSVSEPEFERIVVESGIRGNKAVRKAVGKECFKTAYSFLFQNVIARTLWHIHKLGIVGDQVDFVFDRENEKFDDAKRLLQELRTNLPIEIRNTLGDAVQRDDDKVLPLQAADLIAARSKDQCNDEHNQKLRRAIVALAGTGDNNVTLHLREKHIRGLVNALLLPTRVNNIISQGGIVP